MGGMKGAVGGRSSLQEAFRKEGHKESAALGWR